MSASRVNAAKVFRVLRLGGKLTSTWPADLGASKIENCIYEITWCLSFVNLTCLFVPLILGVYQFRYDAPTMTKALSELTALCEIYVNLIQCRLEKDNFQVILKEIGDFLKNPKGHEEIVIKKYIERYKNFHIFVGSSYISTAILFSCIPYFTSQPLPADAWYPFSITSNYTRVTLYVLQVLAIFHTGMGIVVDFTVATMLWYITAKLDLLSTRMKLAASKQELRACIRAHQHILVLFNKTYHAVRFIILKTNLTMSVAVICSAFQLIHHEPVDITARFILMVIAGCLRLYVTAHPADDLKEMSKYVGTSIYESAWIDKSSELSKMVQIVVYRCQKPLVISVSGIIKTYSLEYYAYFLSTAASAFVKLRAVLEG